MSPLAGDIQNECGLGKIATELIPDRTVYTTRIQNERLACSLLLGPITKKSLVDHYLQEQGYSKAQKASIVH
jgi:hypothetical protein